MRVLEDAGDCALQEDVRMLVYARVLDDVRFSGEELMQQTLQ